MSLNVDDTLVIDLLARTKRYLKTTSFTDEELCGYIEDAMDSLEIYGINGYDIGDSITPAPERKLRDIIAFQTYILAKVLDIGQGETLEVKTEESSYKHSLAVGSGKDPNTLKLEDKINDYIDSCGSSCITSDTPDFGVVLPSDSALYGEGRLG
jgi:hypothetical protein